MTWQQVTSEWQLLRSRWQSLRGPVVASLVALAVLLLIPVTRLLLGYAVLGIITAIITYCIVMFLARIEQDSKSRTNEDWAAGIALLVLLVICFHGYREVSFNHQIRLLEDKFLDRANGSDREIRDHRYDYHGELTQVLRQRNELCNKYHYKIQGVWWVDDRKGLQINCTYQWVPFGILMFNPRE